MSKSVRVTGNTFQYRDRFKQLGGLWSADAKCWRFDWVTQKDIDALKTLPGCMVIEDKPKPPEPRPTPAQPLQGAIDLIDRVVQQLDEKEYSSDRQTLKYGDDPTYFNYFRDKNPIAFFGFSSLGELIKYVENIPPEHRMGERDAGYETDDPKWSGSADMSEAIQIARDGWNDGSDKAAEILEFLNLDNATQRRRAYSIAGGAVSVGRLLAGNPKHMTRRQKLPGRRTITLFVENCASAFVNADMLTVRASIVAAFADILESRGYSCQIVAVTMQANAWKEKPAAQTAVVLKHAGEKLNLADIVFALGHPSFLRRFNFACVCSCDSLREIWETQGTPRSAFNKGQLGRNEFYVPGLKTNFKKDSFIEIAKQMLPLVKSDGLPLELEYENVDIDN